MGERWHGLGRADCNSCISSAALQQPGAVTLAEAIAGRGLSTELREASQGSHLTVLLVLSCGSFKAKVPSQPAVITTSHFIIKSNARLVRLGV